MGCNCEIKKRLSLMAREFRGEPVYLDYNATTPTDPALLGDMDRLLRREWGNSSSLHLKGGEAYLRETETRQTASRLFGKGEDTFQFCSSGCEGISGLLAGTEARDRILITTEADHSVLVQTAGTQYREKHRFIPIDGQGRIDSPWLEGLLEKEGPACLFYSPVNHETGARQNCKALYEAAQRRGALVFIDAVQAAYRLRPEEWAPYCHGFVISGHKFHVPKGIAMVHVREDIEIFPFRMGGGNGSSLFPGTANTPGIALLGKGLELLDRDRTVNERILENLTREGESILAGCRTEIIRESPSDSVPGILCFSLPELRDWEKFFLHLGERRICLSRFSACTGKVEGESAVLNAMGVPSARSSRSLRVSFGRFSKRQDFFALKEAIDSYVQNS